MIHKVLIIDDSLDFRQALSSFLKDYNYDVNSASDGLQALEILKHEKIDLIICDLNMPNMSGLEFLEKLSKKIPVVIISGNTLSKENQKKYKINHFIEKPFKLEELISVLNNYSDK